MDLSHSPHPQTLLRSLVFPSLSDQVFLYSQKYDWYLVRNILEVHNPKSKEILFFGNPVLNLKVESDGCTWVQGNAILWLVLVMAGTMLLFQPHQSFIEWGVVVTQRKGYWANNKRLIWGDAENSPFAPPYTLFILFWIKFVSSNLTSLTSIPCVPLSSDFWSVANGAHCQVTGR